MKIVLLTPAYPLRGGIAASGERLAREFLKEGDAVVLFTYSLQYPGFLFPGKTQYSEENAPDDLDIRITINSVHPVSWFATARAIVKERPDLIVCRFWLPFMGPALGTILRLVKRSLKAPVVAWVDNIVPHEKRPGDRLLAKYFTGAADGFVAMSRSVAEELKTFTKNKEIKYIPHPVYDSYGEPLERSAALQKLNLPENKRYLLFFGFIRKYKGLDLALEAMATPQVKALNLILLVAGEFYEDEAGYRRLVERLGISDKVEIRSEFIPADEVRCYFSAADLIVQPYRSATQSGISQLANHFNKPMLATKVGGLPEIVAHGVSGYIVDPDAIAIADAIVDYFKNNRSESFTKEVIEQKKRFSWQALTLGFKDFVTRGPNHV